MDLWSGLSNTLESIGDFAIQVAPSVIPAALGFGAVRLVGGTTKEALIGAGVAGASNAVMRGMRPGDDGEALGGAGIDEGSISGARDDGTGRPQGTLDQAGISDGNIASRGGGGQRTGGQTPRSLADTIGISGADLLKAGGTFIESLDDTDDEFRDRRLDILEKRSTVAPVQWTPGSPGTNAVTARSATAGAGTPLVRWTNRK